MGDLSDVQRNWDSFGRTDPLWAVLTDPAHPELRGQWEPEAFFRTGEEEIDGVLELLSGMGLTPATERALDFGCGVGRLSQALARTFARVDGVDIAPSMLEAAHSFNQHGEAVQYHLNERDDLRLFSDATFDFIYTNLVLQHMEPRFSFAYLAEFARVLQPGGVLLFMLPSGIAWKPMADAAYRVAIELGPDAPTTMEAGSKVTFEVSVRNTSSLAWDTPGLAVGNHWLDERGATIRFDDGRGPLQGVIAPGATATVPLTVTAPLDPGTYLLEIDVVHEYATWFVEKGPSTVRATVAVAAGVTAAPTVASAPVEDDGAPADAAGDDDAAMEMHYVPVDQVKAHLKAHGLTVVDATHSGGDGTFDYQRYVVRKPLTTPFVKKLARRARRFSRR